MIEAIAAFLDTCRYEVDWLHLPGVGWLTVRSLCAYRFSIPGLVEAQVVEAKRVPWFSAEAALVNALNGANSASGSSPRPSFPDGALGVHVVHLTELLPLAATIREALLRSAARCDVPGLGTFEVRARRLVDSHEGAQLRVSADRAVRLRFAPELIARVGLASDMNRSLR